METNITASGGQQTHHEYEPSSDMTSPEGLQAHLANMLQPVLAKVQQQLTQTARAQIDAAFEPMHEANQRQVDLLVASSRAVLMGEVDRALDSMRENWRTHVERELQPLQMALDEWIGRTLQPLFTRAGGKEAGRETAGQESRKTRSDEGASGDTHQELAQAEPAVEVEGAGKKPGRRATSRKAGEAPKRPTPDQPPKALSTARSSIGPSTTSSSAGAPTTRSSVGKSTARSSVTPATKGSSTRRSSRSKSTDGVKSDAQERDRQ